MARSSSLMFPPVQTRLMRALPVLWKASWKGTVSRLKGAVVLRLRSEPSRRRAGTRIAQPRTRVVLEEHGLGCDQVAAGGHIEGEHGRVVGWGGAPRARRVHVARPHRARRAGIALLALEGLGSGRVKVLRSQGPVLTARRAPLAVRPPRREPAPRGRSSPRGARARCGWAVTPDPPRPGRGARCPTRSPPRRRSACPARTGAS
jgi:hypothetical protein